MNVPLTKISGTSGLYKGRIATFQNPLITIGRDRSNGMCFPLDLILSRQHAKIEYESGTWVAKDLGSRNGTLVNGQRLPAWGSRALKPGDEVRCGLQGFRLEWELPVPVSPPPPPRVQPPVQPVLLTVNAPPVAAPPVHRIPPPPVSTGIQKSKASPYRWISPGESVNVHGRRIEAGLFFYGTAMRDASGYGSEPSLIEPAAPVAESGEESVDGIHTHPTYRQVTARDRGRHLDWLARGRPVETMRELDVLLFLSGLERRFLVGTKEAGHELSLALRETSRLASGAPTGSRMWQRLQEFMLVVQGSVSSSTSAENAIEIPAVLKMTLARKATERSPLSHREALLAILAEPETYTRTPFERCRGEAELLFAKLYSRNYPDGVVPKARSHRLAVKYSPINNGVNAIQIPTGELRDFRISPPTVAKLREFLNSATDALDAYSRRLAGRSHEAGHLPAVALLPAELAEKHPEIDRLREVASDAAATGGRLDLAKVKLLWTDWPSDRPLNKGERELLSKALWHAGFIPEPSPSAVGALGPEGAVFVAPRTSSSTLEPSYRFAAVTPIVSIAALVVLADGVLTAAERERAKSRLAQLTSIDAGEATRLGLYLDWVLESGSPKVGKKAFEAVPSELRRPLIRFLAEVAAADGNVAPAEVKEMVRISKALGVPDDEVYTALHSSQSEPHPSAAPIISRDTEVPKNDGHGLDMERVADLINRSHMASQILSSVFVEEEAPPAAPPAPVFDVAPATASEEHSIQRIVEELLTRSEWLSSDFAQMVGRYGKLPSAAYEDLNDAAYDVVGDPLLDGEDPITVDHQVAQELLR